MAAIDLGLSFLFDAGDDAPTQGNMTVRLSSGKTIELKKKPPKSTPYLESQSNMLDMDTLFARVEYEKTIHNSRKTIREARKLAPRSNKSDQEAMLWTEKYKPVNFIQLCSAGNDRSFRQILHWLKRWNLKNSQRDIEESSFKKLLLLHGPSGTGKTVVSHLLAQQSGYCVVEINAANSLDQQADGAPGLKNRIINALTANTLTSNGKPSCLILDEIDSSANVNEIIKILVDLIRKDGKKSINRPIICIANDAFNGALEKIRPHCEFVAFRKPSTTVGNAQRSLKDFLGLINSAENLNLNSRGIAEVVEICDADIRACINYLQFNRPLESLELSEFKNNSSMVKDIQMSWFKMVDHLFIRDKQLPKDDAYMAMAEILDFAGRSSSSMDKVISGAFARYLDVVHYQDDSLVKPVALSDWLAFYDCSDATMYGSSVCLKMWSLFSELKSHSVNKEPLIERSLAKNSLELYRQNKASIIRFQNQIPSNLLTCGITHYISTVFIPYLDRMLNVGSTKNNSFDVKNIDKVACLLNELDIRMESHKDLETQQINLVYAPSWDHITRYDNSFASASYNSVSKLLQNKRAWLFPLVRAHLDRKLVKKRDYNETLGQDFLSKKLKKSSSSSSSSSTDFFKAYDNLATQIPSMQKTANHEKVRIWVKYHEGFSNAVRKNIGWKDFFIPNHKLNDS